MFFKGVSRVFKQWGLCKHVYSIYYIALLYTMHSISTLYLVIHLYPQLIYEEGIIIIIPIL